MEKISIILPVKNGAKYIADSIDSILAQTFNDFELLIFDDNSTDNTLSILATYQDPRIKIFTDSAGFIPNLNRGIEMSRGKFIARMDADDIMSPIRLQVQYEIMNNTIIDICGSWINIFGEGIETHLHGEHAGHIQQPLRILLHYNFVAHPSVMLRKEFIQKHNLMYENYRHVEDYKLWTEIAKKDGIFWIQPQALLNYRMSEDQVTTRNEEEIGRQSILINNEVYEYLLNKNSPQST